MYKQHRKQRQRGSEANTDSSRQRLNLKVPSPSILSNEVSTVISSGGHLLETETIEFMEAKFGHDFSEVRIHADANAAKSARKLNARAYTVANNIVFDSEQYNPKTYEGKRLIAHELSHVVQQDGTARTFSSELELTKSSDAAEIEADVAASRVVSGEAARVQTKSTPIVARDSYADEAYNILNSPINDEDRLRFLLDAENMSLAEREVPSASLGTLPADSPASGQMDFQNWQLDLNPNVMGTTDTLEDQARLANVVAHEGEHLSQWYEMARLQAGLEGNTYPHSSGPLSQIPTAIASQAQANPILQTDENSYQVQQWYDSVYGSGASHRGDVLRGEDPTNLVSQWRQDDYCRLPEERDAWARGMQVTDQFRRIEGQSAPEWDTSVCNPNELMTPSLFLGQSNPNILENNSSSAIPYHVDNAPEQRQERDDDRPFWENPIFKVAMGVAGMIPTAGPALKLMTHGFGLARGMGGVERGGVEGGMDAVAGFGGAATTLAGGLASLSGFSMLGNAGLSGLATIGGPGALLETFGTVGGLGATAGATMPASAVFTGGGLSGAAALGPAAAVAGAGLLGFGAGRAIDNYSASLVGASEDDHRDFSFSGALGQTLYELTHGEEE